MPIKQDRVDVLTTYVVVSIRLSASIIKISGDYSTFKHTVIFPTIHVVKHGCKYLIFSGALKTIIIKHISIL